jgi:EmrB/QacA subfamily drug resistance transporter
MPTSSRTPVLAIILASYLMIVVDISIVITGLPKIRETLAFSTTGLSWVQNAYTLAFGGLLLLGARAGDILGRRRMFIAGLVLFTLASLAVGFAQSAAWLVVSRAVQGIGAAILAPSTLALIATNFPEGPERTRALAYYAAVAGVGASLGLVLGGLVADLLSWRVGFFINLPIGIALVLAARRYLAETGRNSGEFDVTGALTSTIGMTALVYGIVRSADAGWSDRITMGTVVAGIALLAIFIVNEWRAKQPIMPLRLFANRQRAGAFGVRFLYLGGMLGFWFFTTQYLQAVLGFRPLLAGLAFLATTLPNFASAMTVPKLANRFGSGPVLAAGLAMTVAGMMWLSRVGADVSFFAGAMWPMIAIGIGQGLVLGPLTVAGVAGVAPRDAGAASGLVNVAHQLGGSIGLGLLVVVFASAGSGALEGRELLAHRIGIALAAGSGMLALALVLAFASIMRRPSMDRTVT